MQTSASSVYLDSSALVKLVTNEPETNALRRFLVGDQLWISSALTRVEVLRAARHHGRDTEERAERLLDGLDLIGLDDEVLRRAAAIDPLDVRSLDAVHLASASLLADPNLQLVTYDRRMTEAARELGIAVVAPK